MARRTPRLVTEKLWSRLAPRLPARPFRPQGARSFVDDRECLEGILWVLRSGAPWQAMPADLPSGSTCWRRLRDWSGLGILEELRVVVLEELAEVGRLDLSELQADATFIRGKKGGLTSVTPSAARG